MLFSVEQAFGGGGGARKTSSPKYACVGGETSRLCHLDR